MFGRAGTVKPFTVMGTSHWCSHSAASAAGEPVPAMRVNSSPNVQIPCVPPPAHEPVHVVRQGLSTTETWLIMSSRAKSTGGPA